MKLQIITTQRIMEHDIVWLELETPVGNMIIQPGHAPMIIQLSSGKSISFLQPLQTVPEFFPVVQGIAHITRTHIKILIPADV